MALPSNLTFASTVSLLLAAMIRGNCPTRLNAKNHDTCGNDSEL